MRRTKGPLNSRSDEVSWVISAISWLGPALKVKALCLVLLETDEGSFRSDGEYLWINPDWVVRHKPPEIRDEVRRVLSDVEIKPEASTARRAREGLLADGFPQSQEFRRRWVQLEVRKGLRHSEPPYQIVDWDRYLCPEPDFTTAIYDVPDGTHLIVKTRIGVDQKLLSR